jgi:hypothetical protein
MLVNPDLPEMDRGHNPTAIGPQWLLYLIG